ncbi:MAG: glycosyltransferase [Candidatus Bathyarchaeia archaeon]
MPKHIEATLKRLDATPVSVIIPAHNEEPTVTTVVETAQRTRSIDEVIVVDDGSGDNTSKHAAEAGADVIRLEERRGKGAAMKAGLQKCRGEIVVFMDADLKRLEANQITSLMMPLADGYDLCKANFDRCGGRVTELTAKPLLKIFFPEIKLAQPLSGQKAIRRELLTSLDLEDHYGVDIALLIDGVMRGARVTETYIGQIDHQSHQLAKLAGTAEDVTRTILYKAHRYGRLGRVKTLEHCLVPVQV